MTMKRRTAICLSLCAIVSSADATDSQPASAFFCQGEGGPGRFLAFAAIREIPEGDVEFAVSGWRENGHHFGLSGIAVRDEGVWRFKEWPTKRIEDEKYDIFYDEVDAMAGPSCKVTIQWAPRDRLALKVDERASCAEHAGARYGEKSIVFSAHDYVGPVQDELDGWPENFFNSRRCDARSHSTTNVG